MTSFSWDDASAAFTSGLTAIGMNYHTEVLAPDVQGNITYALVPRRSPAARTSDLDAQREQGLAEQGMGLPRRQLVHQRPDPDQDAAAQLHPSRKSVYEAAKTDENATSSGTSTTSWANRSRSASAARD